MAALLVWQATLGAFVYFYSQNPSLSLVAEGTSDANERFEFSHVGARHTATFLATAQGQADAIRKHWASTGATRAPRVVVSTGGALPYLLPEAYVLEHLVSFRHHCKPALEPLADYAQVIYDADTAETVARERVRQQPRSRRAVHHARRRPARKADAARHRDLAPRSACTEPAAVEGTRAVPVKSRAAEGVASAPIRQR